MSNCSSTSVSRSTTSSEALDARLVRAAGLEDLVVGQRVGDVAGQRELLDPGGQRRVRRRRSSLAGVVGDSAVGRPAVDVDPAVLLAAALAELALDHDRGVVGRVALGRGRRPVEVRADPAHGAAARAAGCRGASSSGRRGDGPAAGRAAAAAGPGSGRPASRSRRAPRRALSRTKSGTTTYGVCSRSIASEPTTKPTAPPASGGPRCRRSGRRPLARWTSPRTPKSSAPQPITWRPAGPVRSGLRMVAAPTTKSTSGTNHAEQADRAVDDRAGALPHPAGQPPPHRGGDDDGQGDEEEADPVAAVLRLELARGVADPAYGRADGVRDAEPEVRDGPGERQEEPRDRPSPAADGPGRGTLAGALLDAEPARLRVLAAGFRPVLLPFAPDRAVEPPCPDLRAGVLLLRDAGGEDDGSPCWRIYPQDLTRHTRHTPQRIVSRRGDHGHGGPQEETDSLLEQRHPEPEGAPLAELGGHQDLPAVHLGDPPRDGQSEAGARDRERLGVARAVERGEQVGLVGGGDAEPGSEQRHESAWAPSVPTSRRRCHREGCTSRRCWSGCR